MIVAEDLLTPRRFIRCGAAMCMLVSGALGFGLVTGCGSNEPPMPSAAQLFLDAQASLAAGDQEKAMTALDASIAAEPNEWAYLMRAKLLLERHDDAAALKDCDAGLLIAPDDSSLAWLKGEIAKPASARFQGRFKSPPAVVR